jgi:hypothetical protein
MRLAILLGAASATLLAFPLAAICVLVYRFPVPFAGYASGIEAVVPVLLGVVFYGILGGFPLLATVGALGGWAAHRKGQPDQRTVRRLAVVFGGVAALLGVTFLAVLDKLIGAW